MSHGDEMARHFYQHRISVTVDLLVDDGVYWPVSVRDEVQDIDEDQGAEFHSAALIEFLGSRLEAVHGARVLGVKATPTSSVPFIGREGKEVG
jgi:hypothetical protein